MWLVFSALFDPFDQDGFFVGGQFEVGFGRGHANFRVGGQDTMHEIAAGEAAGPDGFSARFGDLFVGERCDIQAQVGLLFFGIRSVTGEAFI